MQAWRNSNISGVAVPKLMRSSTVYGVWANFRTVMTGPMSDSGSMIALTREPSGRRASTRGLDSSMRRPSGAMIRSMTRMDVLVVEEDRVDPLDLAAALDVDVVRSVDHDLGDASGRRGSGSSGPKPVTSWTISSTRRVRSSRVTAKPPSSTTRSTIGSIVLRTSPSLASSSTLNAPTTSCLEPQPDLVDQRPRETGVGRRLEAAGADAARPGRSAGSMTGTPAPGRPIGGAHDVARPDRRGVAAMGRAWRRRCAASARSRCVDGAVPFGSRGRRSSASSSVRVGALASAAAARPRAAPRRPLPPLAAPVPTVASGSSAPSSAPKVLGAGYPVRPGCAVARTGTVARNPLRPRDAGRRSDGGSGSGGKIRTYDQAINSRPLYH